MTAEFSIDVDPARDLVSIRMGGFFTAADVERFVAARDAAQARLTCGPNRHLTLNDLRGMKVQAQDMVAAFGRVLAAPGPRSRRLAFVVSPTLARSQLMRALDGREARCFATRAAAKAWLFASDERVAA